jgi:hypothetical protein
MSELCEIFQKKTHRKLVALEGELGRRLSQRQSEFASRGMRQSSMHIQAIVKECDDIYRVAVSTVCEEVEWWLKQCIYVNESQAQKIADEGVKAISNGLDMQVNSYLSRAKNLMRNNSMLDSIINPHQGIREAAKEDVRLFVIQWRAEHQRNIFKSVLNIIKKLVGAG